MDNAKRDWVLPIQKTLNQRRRIEMDTNQEYQDMLASLMEYVNRRKVVKVTKTPRTKKQSPKAETKPNRPVWYDNDRPNPVYVELDYHFDPNQLLRDVEDAMNTSDKLNRQRKLARIEELICGNINCHVKNLTILYGSNRSYRYVMNPMPELEGVMEARLWNIADSNNHVVIGFTRNGQFQTKVI